jgi:hypothetical protein
LHNRNCFFEEEAIYETDDSMEFFFERLQSVMLLVISANSSGMREKSKLV